MKILHICNDYTGSKVHQNLYRELDRQKLEQTVYTYFRDVGHTVKNKIEGASIAISYRAILKLHHRLLYHQKIAAVSRDLMKQTEKLPIDLIHATTLFSDGAVAYRLWKKRGIPYMVTVRNTDINEFLGYAPHTWLTGIKVLRNAKKIVFISKAPMEKFCRHFIIKRILPEMQYKFVLQPNGIDDYWLDNVVVCKPNLNHNIIYVGKFDLNKNVVRLIEAVLALRQEFPDVHLHLVGGDGSREEKIKALVAAHPDCMNYHGKIFDKDKLRELYRQCSVFAMPSIHETFGLVYVEALSQNLAVLYTRNQGIDGLFDERVGEKVNALSTRSIAEGLARILSKREAYLSHEVVDFSQFRWDAIAERYRKLYEEVIGNGTN